MTRRTLTPAGPMDAGPTEWTAKPWGGERLLVRGEHYAAKVLFLAGGQRTSKQWHRAKVETLSVIAGTLVVRTDDGTPVTLGAGDVLHIPAGTVHTLVAPSGDVTVFEVSTPELDDVVRLEDRYGRS